MPSTKRRNVSTMTKSTSNQRCCKDGTNSASPVGSSKFQQSYPAVLASVAYGRHVSFGFCPIQMVCVYYLCCYFGLTVLPCSCCNYLKSWIVRCIDDESMMSLLTYMSFLLFGIHNRLKQLYRTRQ